jgi:hypothetical protein
MDSVRRELQDLGSKMCCSMHVELAKIGLNNNNIILPAWKIRDLLVKATIHRTDTVSVVIGCSPNQIALDINGIIRLTNALSVLEERLSRVIDETHVVKGVQDFSLIVGDSSSGAGCGNVSMGSNRFSRDRCKDTSIIPAHSGLVQMPRSNTPERNSLLLGRLQNRHWLELTAK